MKRFLIFLALGAFALTIYATTIFNTPTEFTTGATLTIDSGVPMLGVWDFSGATVMGLTQGTLTFTGGVTGSGTTSIPLTVKILPDLVSAPGSILSTNIFPPIAPSSGFDKWYTDAAGKRFHDRNDTGATGTTVVGTTPAPYKVVTVINPTNGIVTVQYPQFLTSDPGVFGAGYWSGGVLHQSLASPTPTATATSTPTPTPTP